MKSNFNNILISDGFNRLFESITDGGLPSLELDSDYYNKTPLNPTTLALLSEEIKLNKELKWLYNNHKNSWDGYRKIYKNSVIKALSLLFPNDNKCKKYKPVIWVKTTNNFDVNTEKHVNIKLNSTSRYLEPVDLTSKCSFIDNEILSVFSDGNKVTLLKAIIYFSEFLVRDNNRNHKYIKKHNITELRKIMLIMFFVMMYRTTLGEKLEKKVISDLKELLYNKYGNKWKVINGTFEEEKNDIDCWIINDSLNKKIGVSIKNLGAFSDQTIYHYRFNMKKTLPVYYIGMSDFESNIKIIKSTDIDKKFRSDYK